MGYAKVIDCEVAVYVHLIYSVLKLQQQPTSECNDSFSTVVSITVTSVSGLCLGKSLRIVKWLFISI